MASRPVRRTLFRGRLTGPITRLTCENTARYFAPGSVVSAGWRVFSWTRSLTKDVRRGGEQRVLRRSCLGAVLGRDLKHPQKPPTQTSGRSARKMVCEAIFLRRHCPDQVLGVAGSRRPLSLAAPPSSTGHHEHLRISRGSTGPIDRSSGGQRSRVEGLRGGGAIRAPQRRRLPRHGRRRRRGLPDEREKATVV